MVNSNFNIENAIIQEAQDNKVTLRIKYLWTLFEDRSTGWGLYVFSNIDCNDNGYSANIEVSGYNLPKNPALTYLAEGVLSEITSRSEKKAAHDKNLRERTHILACSATEVSIENSADSIEGFLVLFDGIGKKTAKKIFSEYGKETFNIIEHDPCKLAEIKGITKEKAYKIHDAYMANISYKPLSEFLSPAGFTGQMINSIFAIWGSDALDLCKSNPYALTVVKGVNFYLADALALSEGIDMASYIRVRSAAEYVLYSYAERGNTAMPYNYFVVTLRKVMSWNNVTKDSGIDIEDLVRKLSSDNDIVISTIKNTRFVSLRGYYNMEVTIASMLNMNKLDDTFILYRKNEIRKQYSFLDESQINAVYTVLSHPISVITGGPGTGKTTVIRAIAELFIKYGKTKVVFLSPTGKAARRIEAATGFSADTIHKKLHLTAEGKAPGSQDELLYADLIFVDEASMLDTWTAEKLLSGIGRGKIVFIGDIDQLPSVGAGAFLRDIIESGAASIARLNVVHRQEGESLINRNARRIKDGDYRLESGEDFTFTLKEDMEEIEKLAISWYLNDVARFGLSETVLLTPVKNGTCGVYSLNEKIQAIINPPSDVKKEMHGVSGQVFRPGDAVIQLTNCEEAANGDVGVVSLIKNENGGIMEVTFYDGKTKIYDRSNIEEVMLAYAMTIHKSQGSEYKAVTVCFPNGHNNMLKRNLPYTAFTRAKASVHYVGMWETLCIAIVNDDTYKRTTMLTKLIKDMAAGEPIRQYVSRKKESQILKEQLDMVKQEE